jgi:hypothetical protein
MEREEEDEDSAYNPPPLSLCPFQHSMEEDSEISKEEKEGALIP